MASRLCARRGACQVRKRAADARDLKPNRDRSRGLCAVARSRCAEFGVDRVCKFCAVLRKSRFRRAIFGACKKKILSEPRALRARIFARPKFCRPSRGVLRARTRRTTSAHERNRSAHSHACTSCCANPHKYWRCATCASSHADVEMRIAQKRIGRLDVQSLLHAIAHMPTGGARRASLRRPARRARALAH